MSEPPLTSEPPPKKPQPQAAVSRPALELLRLDALERMTHGELAAAMAAALGMSRATTGAGRPCKLTPLQQRQVFTCLDGKHPRPMQIDRCDVAPAAGGQQANAYQPTHCQPRANARTKGHL